MFSAETDVKMMILSASSRGRRHFPSKITEKTTLTMLFSLKHWQIGFKQDFAGMMLFIGCMLVASLLVMMISELINCLHVSRALN